jgi:uncharacterized membrane protein
MVELYLFLKWLHVVSACIAFGSNVTHFFWILSANRDPVNGANILRVVKVIDDRLAVPAYVVTILCGATMWLWQWPFESSWIWTSLVLSIILTVMGISFGPFMKKWIVLAKDTSPQNQPLFTLARRLTIWWGSIAASVIVILYMMVWKPVLW